MEIYPFGDAKAFLMKIRGVGLSDNGFLGARELFPIVDM